MKKIIKRIIEVFWTKPDPALILITFIILFIVLGALGFL